MRRTLKDYLLDLLSAADFWCASNVKFRLARALDNLYGESKLREMPQLGCGYFPSVQSGS